MPISLQALARRCFKLTLLLLWTWLVIEVTRNVQRRIDDDTYLYCREQSRFVGDAEFVAKAVEAVLKRRETPPGWPRPEDIAAGCCNIVREPATTAFNAFLGDGDVSLEMTYAFDDDTARRRGATKYWAVFIFDPCGRILMESGSTRP